MKFAAALALLGASIAIRNRYLNSIVPEPYLDEVFHIPQAQAYCRDEFTTWDPKLTTPAGLYLLSYPLSYLSACDPPTLRAINGLGVALVIPMLIYRIRQTLFGKPTSADAAHTALNVALFPLLYFFSGLYYTDVWSTISVLLGYLACIRKQHVVSAIFCWASLWFRQTNVLWTVFMAGLAAVAALPTTIDDPTFASASYSHIFRTPLTILLSATPAIIRPLVPYAAVLASFASFLAWNNFTIVLGDASAHAASLHLPQLLYFFSATAFFSFPLLLHVRPHILPALPLLPAFAAAVHYNSVLHSYLLADNRHYTFYVFRRLLLRAPLAPVPAYYAAAALCVAALGRVRVSWALLWIAATAAGLVSAPLVEPRYFLVPWVLWRVHVVPGARARWAETAWLVAVNVATTWVFGNWGFEWESEKGAVQRFMW